MCNTEGAAGSGELYQTIPPFLYGREFIVRTDHSSLRWLLNFKNAEGQLARWLEVLCSCYMKIEHRPGQQHRNADAVSRIPCKQCGFSSDWEETQKNVFVVQAGEKCCGTSSVEKGENEEKPFSAICSSSKTSRSENSF